MPKINHEEYEKIKLLPDYDWNWIAREKAGKILSFTNKPTKTDEVWKDKQTRLWFNYKDSQLFQFIQWEDEDPYNIAELIEEYEDSKEYKDSLVIEYFLDKAKEGEETEVKKDIEWLKSAIQQNLDFYNDNDEEWQMAKVRAYAKSLDLINQLDEPEAISQIGKLANFIMSEVEGEPSQNQGAVDTAIRIIKSYQNQEVLTREWIDDNKSLINGRSTSPDGTKGDCYDAHYIHVLKLQNLLAPKQEEVDRAYKDGYEEGRERGFYKGYREGLGNKGGEPETVADVIADFFKSLERLKEVMSMEVEELEE